MVQTTFQNRGLIQQGYNQCGIDKLRSLSNGLRFTPTLCMSLAIIGLATQTPMLHFALAGLGIIPFWFPKYHPFDVLYNKVVRHIFNGQPLPSNPLPRRIACVMGGFMNILIGVAFVMGSPLFANIFGAILIALQIIVISTHFCVASWMWEGLSKVLNIREDPMDVEEAVMRISHGALLIDVREPHEYQTGHIRDAINVPLDVLTQSEIISSREVILYCQSGIRALAGKKKLAKAGNNKVFNLGAMSRWDIS